VHDVKEIIRCLHDISSEIPENLATVAHGPNANVSVRTTASLQLMLYQVSRFLLEAYSTKHIILEASSSVEADRHRPPYSQYVR
jgi:hypothetical protein